MTTIHDVHPWYERGPDGVSTGRGWPTEDQAATEVAVGCTVHQETSARVGEPSFGTTAYTQPVRRPVRAWKPRGFGGTD